jgi:cysteine synthase
MANTVLFPTFEEMLHPNSVAPEIRARARAARDADPLNPVNYFNINWQKPDGSGTNYFVMPKSLTNVDCEIVVLVAKDFPTGSHKVGPAYSVMAEKYRANTRLSFRAPATMASAAAGLDREPGSKAW